ncbi:MAG: endonuclease, partial [Chloroflexia bacterium]|nr:endonuclease [Chloroflexia bacterium]
FFSHYTDGSREVSFERDEFVRAAQDLGIALPKNVGDLIYSFRYRTALPQSISDRAPAGEAWIIRSVGRGSYTFATTANPTITPNLMAVETKIPDATPGVISMYALSDEQALLARLRYNRLIDIFTGVTCYSLQNHLRTSVPNMGQVETDEVYIGIDKRGVHYVFPIQAKGGSDRLSIVQIEQDVAICAAKFPALLCRPVAAQFIGSDLIALFSFQEQNGTLEMTIERHYRLVPPEALMSADLQDYSSRSMDE